MPQIEHMTKAEIIAGCISAVPSPIPGHNRMGCSEDWYDPFYCLHETFSEGELGAMTEQELNNLYRLAAEITSALY